MRPQPSARQRQLEHLVVGPLLCWALLAAVHVDAQEEFLPNEDFADDHTQNVAAVRKRIETADNTTLGGKLGVVIVAGPKDEAYSQLTIPLWREYCKKHGMGFWVQKEPLNTDYNFGWTKPRLLMELLPVVKWRYLLVVDANTLPKKFDKPWDQLIKLHMREKRWGNDDPGQRNIFCGWDCDDEYKSQYEDGACSGPVLTVCIYDSRKPQTQRLVKSWYAKRKDPDIPTDDDGPTKGFDAMKNKNWETVFYRDASEDIGRPTSKFIPAYSWTEEHKWNLRDLIHNVIKKDPKLAGYANAAAKAAEHAEL